MRNYPTRNDKLTETIDAFLANVKQQSISIRLYGREIKKVKSKYPQLTVEKGQRYLNTDLFVCNIHKITIK